MTEMTGRKRKALKALAHLLYRETDMAEPFSELTQGEQAHYFDLAEKCFSKIAPIYGLDEPGGLMDNAEAQNGRAFDLSEKAVPFKELSVGATAVLIDRIDDGDGDVEIRAILFRRADGVFSSPTEPEGRFIPSYRMGMIQGAPGQRPRYSAIRATPFLSATAASIAVFPVRIDSLNDMLIPADPKAGKAAQRKA